MSLYSRLDRIAADVEKLNKQVTAVANAPQSQRTSVEGGSIDFNDADGNLKAIVGMQDDGGYTTNVVSGPTPPTPANFTVEVDYGKLVVHWDGSFGDALVAPTDWARAEVYAQEGQFVTPSRELARGSMVAASGGEVTVGVLRGQWTVCMAGWSQAGIMSPMSAPVTVEVPGYGDLVQETLDEAQELIDEAKVALEAGQADLAGKITSAEAALAGLQSTLDNLDSTTLPALRSDLDAAEGRLTDTEGQITDAFGQIVDARNDASADATSKANAAEAAAKSAAQAYDTALKGQIDSTINQAKADLTADINAVRTSANGKNTVTWSTSTPPASYSGVVSDTWFVMSGAGSGATVLSQWRWNGNVWVSTKLSQAVLAQIDIGTGTFGEMDGARLKAGSIYADRIVSGLSQNMVPDPGFVNSTINTARLTSAFGYGGATFAIADGVLSITADGSSTSHPNMSLSANSDLYAWATYPAMKVVAKAQARVESGSGQIAMVVRFKRRDGTVSASVMAGGYQSASPEWAEYVWDYTLPQDVASFSVVLQVNRTTSNGVIEFRSPFVASAVGGTVIEDGAITTEKVAANAINAGKIAAGAIEAGHIKAGAITIGTVTNLQSNLDAKETPAGAQSKADTARTSAVSTAASDATTKANQAVTTAGTNAATQYGETKTLVSGWKTPGQTTIAGGQITTESIAADKLAANVLEVGNLKAGVAAIAEAVVQKIAASTASIQQADIKNLFVTGTSSLSNVVAERIAAETAEFIELEVGNLVAGTGTMDTATVNKLFADVVVASMAQAQEFIGENAILTGAVTAPKITASEELWAKIGEFVKIRAEHIEADAIDGMVITGPTIRSAATGRRWTGDASGIRIFNEDNEVRTRLSPEGSTFKGEVEADTLVVNGGSELRSTDNKLGQGARFTLEAGVTDPTAPPTVQAFWDGLDFSYPDYGGLISTDMVGLAYDGTSYWSMKRSGNWGDYPNGTYGNAVRVNATTGASQGFAVPFNNSNERFGVTCIGSELFWLYRSGYKAYVLVTDLNCVKKREWEYTSIGYSPTNPLAFRPGIGNDGTNIVIAHCNDDGYLIWRTFNKTTGALIGNPVENGFKLASDISGVYSGVADHGSPHVTIRVARSDRISTFTTAGVADSSKSWYAAAWDSTGIVYADGKWRTFDPAGTIHEYADSNMGDDTNNWWATYRWSVDSDEDGTNDYTSRIGPVKRFFWGRRARMRFMGAPLPAGVGYISPSIAYKATAPTRTDFRTPPFSVFVGESVAWYSTLSHSWQSGSPPADSNDFPNGVPSTLASASSTFQVNGDGSGRWGPLTFNADGTMSSSAIPAWVPITSFASGFSAQSWGFAPAYRIWPDGKVEWRGVVAGNFLSSQPARDPFTVPAAARPAQAVNVPAATSGPGSLMKRVEFSSNASPATLRVYAGDSGDSAGWVSLDGIHYYLT